MATERLEVGGDELDVPTHRELCRLDPTPRCCGKYRRGIDLVKSFCDFQENLWPSQAEFGEVGNELVRANATQKSATGKAFHHHKHAAEPIRIAVRQDYAWRRKMRIGEAVLDGLFEPGLNGVGASGIEAQDHWPTAPLATQTESVHL
jgi:hypothetical protein